MRLVAGQPTAWWTAFMHGASEIVPSFGFLKVPSWNPQPLGHVVVDVFIESPRVKADHDRRMTSISFSSDPDSYSSLFYYVFLTWKTVLALPPTHEKKHVVFCISLIPQRFVWHLSGKQGSRLAIPACACWFCNAVVFFFCNSALTSSSLDDACTIYGAEKRCR